MAVEGGDVREMIDFVNTSGIGAIGTVDDAGAQVERLVKQSGGFGAMLLLAHEWANPRGHAALLRADRPARDARVPGPGAGDARGQGARDRTRDRLAEQQNQAVAHMTEKYQQEVAAGRT